MTMKRGVTGVTPLFSAAAGKITAASAAVALGLRTVSAATTAAVLRLRKFALSGWEKLIHRELKVLEKGTGVIGIAGTFLVGHAKIVGGHQQLNIPFQLDDAELSQRDIQLTALAVDHQIFLKAAANISGDIGGRAAAAAAGIQRFAAKNHRIDHFHNCYRQIGTFRILHILGIPAVIRAENTGIAFAAEQNRPLIIDSQPIQRFGTAYTAGCIQGNAVKIPDIHREEAAVIGDGLYVNGGVEQLSFTGLDIYRVFQDRLGCTGQVDPKIPETFFFTTGIVYFSRMDTNSLIRRGIAAERARRNLFRHIVEPPE